MTKFVFASAVALTIATFSFPPPKAHADGIGGSTARAYCDYFRLKIRSASRQGSYEGRSPDYWRQVYRQCLKDHGY